MIGNNDTLLHLCPFAVYYLRYTVTSFFTISRISLADSKTAGQKVHRKIAVAVQNVKPLYFLSRSFEICEKYCQQSYQSTFVLLPGLNTRLCLDSTL
jgi:hypothetical protein